MQYELNLNNSEEVKNVVQKPKKKSNIRLVLGKLTLILVIGILLGRVSLLLNQSDSSGIAPFGIAYLLAVVIQNKRKNSIFAGIGVGVGYLTINSSLTDGYIYLIATSLITLYYIILPAKRKKKELMGFVIVFLSFLVYGALINKYEIGVNVTLCLIETLVIVPVYYVIKYAINSLRENNFNYLFSSEEIVSIGILVCFLVAGIGDIAIKDYSIKTILALSVVLVTAYVGGATCGSMIGVAMGIILGVASNDMMACVGFFGVGGLIVGIFKDTGKIFSILAGIIIYSALGLYSNAITLKFGVEVLASCVIFLCIPKTAYKSIEIAINPDKKKVSVGEVQLNSIKEEFTFKLKELTSVLTTVADCLSKSNYNEKLVIEDKGSALVESLADRCCSVCENKGVCWNDNFNQTYKSFQELLQNCEGGNLALPQNLIEKCVRRNTLIKNTEALVNDYKVNETNKERLSEGRRIVSDHINNISSTLDNLLSDFKRQVIIDTDLEKRIKRGVNKSSVNYSDIFCYTDISGRSKIRISMNNCKGADYCEKNVVPLISNILKKPLCICDDGCSVNPQTNECVVTIEEKPKYYMLSYSAAAPKKGESQIGDSYSFGKTTDGCYVTILSDGMGSGPQAGNESKATVELVERFVDAGFNENVTVNTVNSIMGMRFAEDEKYATLDLSRVNLYNGKASFVKIGAVPSFIKRGHEVKSINSKNLPFGLVDEVEVEIIEEELKPGDILVSVSDGILDIDKFDVNKFIWLGEYLKDANSDPRELSEIILNKAKELSKNTIKDDMTVIVSKVYAVS